MSSVEDENSNIDEDNAQLSKDGAQNPEAVSEVNISLDPNKNSETTGVISQNMPQPATRTPKERNDNESTTNSEDLLNENVPKSDEIQLDQSELSKVIFDTNEGKGSGDYTAVAKISDDAAKKIEGTTPNVDKNSKVIGDGFLVKCDPMNDYDASLVDDPEDEEMELRWDDDDSSNLPADDGKIMLSEEQLLEDSSDVLPTDSVKNSKHKSSDIDLDTEETSNVTDEISKLSKEIEMLAETSIITEQTDEQNENKSKEEKDQIEIKTSDNTCKLIETKVLKIIEMKDKPSVDDFKMDILAEESLDKHENDVLEGQLLEEIPDTVLNDEVTTVPADIGSNLLAKESEMEISIKDNIDTLQEEELLADTESIAETDATTVKDALSIKDTDDIMLEETLLEEVDKIIETPKTKTVQIDKELDKNVRTLLKEVETIVENSKINAEHISMSEELDNNKLSEKNDVDTEGSEIVSVLDAIEKIKDKIRIVSELDATEKIEDKISSEVLEEKIEAIEATEIALETDVPMENDDKDRQLLKDDSSNNMDVDQSIEAEKDINFEKSESKIEAGTIDKHSEIKNTSKDYQKVMVEVGKFLASDLNKNTDKLTEEKPTTSKQIEQPLLDKIIDLPVVEPEIPVELNMDRTTENQINLEENTTELIVMEVENKQKNQPIDQNIAKGVGTTEKDQISITEQITDNVLQTETLTNLSTTNIEIQVQETSSIDNITPEKDSENKLVPEKVTETVNKESTLDTTDNVEMEVLEKSSTDNITIEEEIQNTLEPEVIKGTTNEIDESIPQDSPVRIRTDHGLHKPDVMLEIPTQELIDMDDTDMSFNLDQTESVASPNNIQNVENDIVSDITLEQNDKNVTVRTTADQTIVQKVENILVPNNPADQVDDADGKTADTVKEKAVSQDATVAEKTVDEVQTTTECSDVKNVKDSAVKETIEECFERMFAEDPVVEAKETEKRDAPPAQPEPASTSKQMTPDTSDEVPEVSDSLGLLAESAGRMMEDDDDDEDADEDDDFDQDESSNQISAEQSEDSNPPASETESARELGEKEIETPDTSDVPFQFTIASVTHNIEDSTAEKMDVEEGTVELQAESLADKETESPAEEPTKDDAPKEQQIEAPPQSTDEMDIETVKLSDTSDNEVDIEPTKVETPVLEQMEEAKEQEKPQTKSSSKSPSKSPNLSPSKQSPSKMKKLEITTLDTSNVVNFVDLEESSSSEDDIQEVQKQPEPETSTEDKHPSPDTEDVTTVNIPKGIDIMSSGENTSEIVTKEGEVLISRVPKPPPHKPARLNTSEVSIKTASNTEPLVIPETTIGEQTQTAQSKPKLSLEIFSLDSDEEESATKEKSPLTSPLKMTAVELEKARESSKCINYCCTSGNKVPYKVADASVVAYYDAGRKRRSMVCLPCADFVTDRTKNLLEGIKNLTPLLDLEMDKLSQDLVEISDSESEDEEMTAEEPKESIGEVGAKFLEDNLAELLNATWNKFDMDTRLKETQIMLDDEIEKLEQDSREIDAMLNECQIATDKLRSELYATFDCQRQELPALVIFDTPEAKFTLMETDSTHPTASLDTMETRQSKRRMSAASNELPAKRPAIPLGYFPLDAEAAKEPKPATPTSEIKLDDDKDISVVKLSAESAPADLPPPGEISRPPLRVSMPVYAMKNAFGPWLKGKILEIQPRNQAAGVPFSLCRVKFDHKCKANGKILAARCIAYAEPADVRMTIGTRLIALFKDSNKRESFYSGVVAEIPNPVNNYRYLVFFDDGYAQYVQHQHTRLVCESSSLVWEEVHPFSRDFVREYLLAYPERPMVRLHDGQHLKTEWNGKWWSSRVTKVDASLAQVMFVGDGRREWIYRGSTRLAPLYLELRAAERHRPRPMPRSKAQPRSNMPYVEYTRSDEQEASKQPEAQVQQQQQQQQTQSEDIRRQRAVAKKSTTVPAAPPPPQQHSANNLDTVTSRVVYYTPKNAVKPYKMTPHKCGPKCKRSDVLSLKDLRTYNPLAKPLLSGWERQIVRFKGHKEVMYRAPCGRRVRSMRELHAYLRAADSELPVDLFDFHPATHCLAEFVLNKCRVGKKDLSHGKENVPVPCVNYYDDSLPEFCSYNTERTPTAGVPLNIDPDFLCGCDCTDDCQDKSKCACWKMTLEGARTIGLDGPNVGYVYKRLPEPLPSGIYECNSRCKCKHTCLNRVAQHPLQLKLQVFKTLNRGWGIRALNDVPKGSFLCVYAGNLLTDATANLDGLNEGDEYLAELDYIEVVEQMKEGYEEDIPEADKKLDKKEQANEDDDDNEEEPSSSDDEETASKTDKEDDDFRPGYIGLGVMEFNKRLRKREKSEKKKEKAKNEKEKDAKDKEKDSKETKDANAEDDCITISDDEEVREPSRFMVQAGMGANEFISKYKSVRTLFGKDEACYIMDAKVQGNIGRYLNHSCCPNVFVQNVFVDTHDPRFPWVAFFALSHIKAGTELTWNYNYDVGSVPGKVLYCYCGAPNCRGRLL